jgi:hypothetical protein
VTAIATNETGKDLTLDIDKYTVNLTQGTGVSGFMYKIGGGLAKISSGAFDIPYGHDLEITAVMITGYGFSVWSDSSTDNPLTLLSVTGDVTLSATGVLKEYDVTLTAVTGISSFTYKIGTGASTPYTAPFKITHGESLTFSVRTADGYTARLSLSGADVHLQTNGWYEIRDIRSDVHVNISVQSDGGSGGSGGDGSGSGSGGYGPGTGGGSGSGSGSGDTSIPYWVPVLIIAAILGCAAVALVFFRHRNNWN